MKYSKDPIYRELMNSRQWRELRAKKLQKHPFCERCKAVGIYTWATEVHHIQPIESARGREAMTRLAYSMNNLQSLCHKCHVEAHRELGKFSKEGRAERTESKVKAFEEKFFKC